jgi:hypothetical protein
MAANGFDLNAPQMKRPKSTRAFHGFARKCDLNSSIQKIYITGDISLLEISLIGSGELDLI